MYRNGNWKVLIAENDNNFQKEIISILKDLEYSHRPVSFIRAYSYNETIAEIKNNPNIALIILNINVDRNESAEKIIKYIRKTADNRNLRIIVTAKNDDPVINKEIILKYDISAFIKESETYKENLIASVYSSLRAYNDIQNILAFKKKLEMKVEMRTEELEKTNAKLIRSIKKLERDWYAGRKIQLKLLPKEEMEFGNLKFSRRLFPSMYLSGDFVDYFYINDENICFYIADVSGHGISSALVTVVLKSFMNSYLEDYKLNRSNTILDPPAVLSKINEELLRENLGKYMTMFYAVLNIKTSKLSFTNGGHFPLPLIYDTKTAEFIKAKGKPAGLFDFVTYEVNEITLPEEFLMLLLSDGIMEIINEKNLDDKLEYIKNTVNNINMDIDQLLKIFKLNEDTKLPDDVTFLMLKRKQN